MYRNRIKYVDIANKGILYQNDIQTNDTFVINNNSYKQLKSSLY